MTRATRRGLLGGAAVLAVPTLPTMAAPAISLDAELLALTERWLAVEAKQASLFELECSAEARGDQAEKNRLFDLICADVKAQHELRDAIFQIQPQTLDGVRAQARVILAFWGPGEGGTDEEVMSYNFAEYVLALTGGVA